MPLLFAALVTIVFAVVLYYLDRRTKFGTIPSWLKQSIYGICFGLAAAVATEFGSFELMGAAMNCRDAAPITAGLLFGPWAGVLAGVLGAVDRFFIATPIFGIGAYTQGACAFATLFAGCFAALLKATLFKKTRPTVLHAFIIVLVTEVVHMALVPLGHLEDIENAVMVVYNTFLYLVVANLIVVLVVFLATGYMEQRFNGIKLKDIVFNKDYFFKVDLIQSFQFWLLLILFVSFGFMFALLAGSHELNSTLTTNQNFQMELNSLKGFIVKDAQRYNVSTQDMALEYTEDWSSGETAIYELAEKDTNKVIGTSAPGLNFAETSVDRPELVLYYQKMGGRSYYIMYTYLDNFKISLAITEKYEMFIPHLITVSATFLLIIIFGILMFAVFKLLRRMIADNLEQVNESLDKLAKGEFDEKVEDSAVTQFSELSKKINTTVGSLKEEIEKEATKYNAEFEMAHEIQVSSLPNVFPAFPDNPEVDVYARYRSAKEVGGDFYDYYYVGKNKICFVIADVSGKGIPAAMFMMRAKSAIQMFARNTKDPARTLYETNNYLCDNNIADMFVTAWVGILDIETGKLKYSSAGHNPPIVIDSDEGKTHLLQSKVSLVLGGMPNVKYHNNVGVFDPGQILFLYTDGVPEANNPKGNLYGEVKLAKYLSSVAKKEIKEICDGVIDEVDKFANGTEQFDDITILALKYMRKNHK